MDSNCWEVKTILQFEQVKASYKLLTRKNRVIRFAKLIDNQLNEGLW